MYQRSTYTLNNTKLNTHVPSPMKKDIMEENITGTFSVQNFNCVIK